MKNAALLAALFGCILLGTVLLFQKPVYVTNQHELLALPETTYVSTSGAITDIRAYGSAYLITLDNGISAIVDRQLPPDIKVTVIGAVDIYQNQTRIQAIEVQMYDS